MLRHALNRLTQPALNRTSCTKLFFKHFSTANESNSQRVKKVIQPPKSISTRTKSTIAGVVLIVTVVEGTYRFMDSNTVYSH
jgi:hypothetical protein